MWGRYFKEGSYILSWNATIKRLREFAEKGSSSFALRVAVNYLSTQGSPLHRNKDRFSDRVWHGRAPLQAKRNYAPHSLSPGAVIAPKRLAIVLANA